MIFWSIAIAVTAIACAALLYAAAGRTVNAGGGQSAGPDDHFRLLLAGIDTDLSAGKLDEEQATAARAELAREMLRTRQDAPKARISEFGRGPLFIGLGMIAALSLGLYAFLGSPNLPAAPLAGRSDVAAQALDLDQAISTIEARLATSPDDLRGWTVIAPAYMETGRFADAARAYRRIIALSEPTPELRTNLAEALLLAANGAGSAEAMDELRQAAAADPTHIQSRLYLAAELMRQKNYAEAIPFWQQAIALATGDEPWLPAARQGLAVAQADGVDTTADQQAEMIGTMVAGLEERLAEEGGSVEEWTQLVRSYLVLGDKPKAQSAYDRAVAAYPAAFDRGELDTIALAAGLTLKGATP